MEAILEIKLFGQIFKLKTEAEENKAKEIVEYFIKEVDKIQGQQREKPANINKYAILILAALNIANENLELKRSKNEFLKNISEKMINFELLLDNILK